jgi:hypothetical protein
LFNELAINREAIIKVLAVRYLQSQACIASLAKLAVFCCWVAMALCAFPEADQNRVALISPETEQMLSTALRVLGIDMEEVVRKSEELRPKVVPGVLPALSAGDLVCPERALVRIPPSLLNVIGNTITARCERHGVPTEPALCLICGGIFCLGNTDDAQESDEGDDGADHFDILRALPRRKRKGECTQHAMHCGRGQCLFLMPYMSAVLAVSCQNDKKNGIWEAPFEDAHGETDLYLKRHCNLTLGPARVKRLQELVLCGQVTSEIVRVNERTGRYMPQLM